MSVNWLWHNKIGYITFKCKDNPRITARETIYLGSNCLCVFLTIDKKTYRFDFWANDKMHFERLLGLRKNTNGDLENIFVSGYPNWEVTQITIKPNEELLEDKDLWFIVECFVRANFKVVMKYKK